MWQTLINLRPIFFRAQLAVLKYNGEGLFEKSQPKSSKVDIFSFSFKKMVFCEFLAKFGEVSPMCAQESHRDHFGINLRLVFVFTIINQCVISIFAKFY